MSVFIGMLAIIATVEGSVYMTPMKDHMLSNMLLLDIIDRMGNDLVDSDESYLEYQDNGRVNNDYNKLVKEIPAEIPIDYSGIETLNPNPSIRDQEYLHHSTLLSHQRLNENSANNYKIQLAGLKGIKEEKSDNTLPAYCTPPNPCPIGYTSENNCLENFENTAVFSRNFQAAQDCMCDTEHMIDCINSEPGDNHAEIVNRISNTDFDDIVEHFQETNPYFRGEKLPIAAKKGLHINAY